MTDFKNDKERFNHAMEHLLLEFDYGSSVYGTLTEKSDRDIVCVTDDTCDFSDATNGLWEYNDGKLDYQFMKESDWIERVKNHHILWLECYSLSPEHILLGNPADYMQYFTLDRWKLRQVCSQIASNAWAKCHKKLTVEADYDLYRAQKSLFHCLRVLMFATQIARYGKITDYTEANKYWTEIYSTDPFIWEDVKAKYQPIVNELRSAMVKQCPKPEGYKQDEPKPKKKKKKSKETVSHRDYATMWRTLGDDKK